MSIFCLAVAISTHFLGMLFYILLFAFCFLFSDEFPGLCLIIHSLSNLSISLPMELHMAN